MKKIKITFVSLLMAMISGNVFAEENQGITQGQEVNLGLSVNWAGWNIGASSPEEYGNYYAFGVLAEGCVGQENCEGYFSTDVGVDMYQIPTNIYGKTKYDAASYFWGGKWRMPSQKEMKELCTKCEWTWIEYNGVDGYKVKGPNGNAIFLPAAGYSCEYYGNTEEVGSEINYWSGQLSWAGSGQPYYMTISEGNPGVYVRFATDGLSLRAVKPKATTSKKKSTTKKSNRRRR